MTKTDLGTSRTADPTAEAAAGTAVNIVQLCGRVSSAPIERELPSGDALVTFRVSVPRPPGGGRSRATSDWVDYVAWSARMRRSVRGWQTGDRVEVEGALRRRFYRVGTGASTRIEVEVLTGRRVSRAPA